MEVSSNSAGSSFAKRLASCNKTTRDKALRLLQTWLESQNSITDDDMRKIWKGLFYCVWHADKQPVQTALINRLASLIVTLDLHLSIPYFEIFISTIRREWSGIDFLRLDKFYLLIRRFMHNFFLLLKKNSWDLDLLRRLIGVLSQKTLLIVDKHPAQGVNYHICEVFLEELNEFLPLSSETLDVLLNPFFSMLGNCSDKVLLNKIKSNVFDCLLKNGKKFLKLKSEGESADSGNNVEKFGTIALTLNISAKLFDLGSSPESLQGNRKIIFSLHEEFLKLEKDLEKTGMEIAIPCVNGGSEEPANDSAPAAELEDVVELAAEPEDGFSGGKLSKKRKKSKKKSDGSGKKSKTMKNGFSDSIVTENILPCNDGDNDIANVDSLNGDGNSIALDESVISNLQKQFEKVAAEVGMSVDGTLTSLCDMSTMAATDTVSKKRKRVKSKDVRVSLSPSEGVVGASANGKSGEKSAKKVRFSMKSNLVWKPHSPLPPQSLRLPPSATPRGSALKKGVPPGPVKDTPTTMKKAKKRANIAKKGRKGSKSVSPAIKRLRKLQSFSV